MVAAALRHGAEPGADAVIVAPEAALGLARRAERRDATRLSAPELFRGCRWPCWCRRVMVVSADARRRFCAVRVGNLPRPVKCLKTQDNSGIVYRISTWVNRGQERSRGQAE